MMALLPTYTPLALQQQLYETESTSGLHAADWVSKQAEQVGWAAALRQNSLAQPAGAWRVHDHCQRRQEAPHPGSLVRMPWHSAPPGGDASIAIARLAANVFMRHEVLFVLGQTRSHL